MCAETARRLGEIEAIGGVVLEAQPLGDLSSDLFERTLQRLRIAPTPLPDAPKPVRPSRDLGFTLPAPIASQTIGPWRWMGPGMQFARIDLPEDEDNKLVLLRIAPGRTLPMHGHSGSELTLVLKGAYRDENGLYGPGDLDEEDDQTSHQPLVVGDEPCICLASIEGTLKMRSWIARAFQPLIGL
jgi:putative transcriptional regulator